MADEAGRPKDVTSRDVALALGVSQSMVSRAFDPAGRVAKAKRELILRTAAAMGYRPNVIARSLSTRRSGIVAIVMGGMDNPFYAEVLDQMAATLDEAGYRSLLFRVPPGKDVDDQLPALRQYNVDALIVASASISSRIADEWQRDRRRVVLFNRTVRDQSVPSISCDNEAGAAALADLLVDRGHERIVYVAGPQHTSTNREREAGFIRRLMERGASLAGRIETEAYSFQEGFRAAAEAMSVRPDAVFFANDVLALGGMDRLRRDLGRAIPDDLSVVGFDDIPMSAWPSYDLTTIRQPIAEMVRLAAQAATGSEDAPARQVVTGELVLRGSVRLA